MNLLLSAPPTTLRVGARVYPLRTDFRVGVRLALEAERALPEAELLARALALYFPEQPEDPLPALEALLWFYRCGAPEQKASGAHAARPLYSFSQDAPLIYAAFRQAYGLDLARERLHWWHFRALLDALPEDCAFCRVLACRALELKDLPPAERRVAARLKERFALRTPSGDLAARDARLLAQVAQRYREAFGRNDEKKG